jgi:uncharacterized protein YkwD
MKNFQKAILFLFMLIAMTGCGSLTGLTASQSRSEDISATETVLAAMLLTEQARNVQAALPTEMPSSTFTPLPSATHIPSATFIPSSTPTETPTATQVILPTATKKVVVPPVTNTGGSCGASLNSNFEAQVIALINQERANNGLGGLSSSGALSNAARNHSIDMACNNFMSHTGSNGSDFGSRLSLAGFSFSAAGENVAAGHSSPADVVAAWMSSEGHRANILNTSFTHIGVGYANSSGATYKHYWTANFGRP